jgi:hypothetical protein
MRKEERQSGAINIVRRYMGRVSKEDEEQAVADLRAYLAIVLQICARLDRETPQIPDSRESPPSGYDPSNQPNI